MSTLVFVEHHEGEAQRNAVFAEAFQRDPGFFEFYRSMIAYSNALLGNSTTRVVAPCFFAKE